VGARAKTVQEYLEGVDYSWKGYVPSKEALMFVNFIKEVNAGSEENETPVMHLAMMDNVFNTKRRCLELCFRGSAKTSLFGEYLILYIAAFGKLPGFGRVDLMLYVSDSIENGVKNLRRNVEFRFENSEFLQKLIPKRKLSLGTSSSARYNLDEYEDAAKAGVKFTDIRLEFVNYRGDHLVVKGYGASTGVRGTKELGQRPTLAVLDDIISDEDARSPTVISTIENTVYKAVSKALAPSRQKIIWLGTPFNANDPIYKAVESGAWNVSVYPVCEHFDSRTTKDEFVGAWEDRFSYEYVKSEFDEAMALGRPSDFYQELMLQITSEEARLVPDSHIMWYNRDIVLDNKESFNWYITTDFASSTGRKADFSVISVWAYGANNDWFLVDGWHDKVLFSQALDRLFDFASMYKTNLLGVGVEISAQQKSYISIIQEKQIREQRYFTLATNTGTDLGIRPASDKFSRFNQVQPLFANHKVYFPNELKNEPYMVELLTELRGVDRVNPNPKKIGSARHDDILDTISMLTEMSPVAPTYQPDNIKKRDDGVYMQDYEDDDEYVSSYSW
jgi:predicted phage terminase large subunit-like protein